MSPRMKDQGQASLWTQSSVSQKLPLDHGSVYPPSEGELSRDSIQHRSWTDTLGVERGEEKVWGLLLELVGPMGFGVSRLTHESIHSNPALLHER